MALGLLFLFPLYEPGMAFLNFDFQNTQGVLQTYTSVYPMAHGSIPGRDYVPYIGIGPVIMIYPLFKIMGGTVFAAYAAQHLMSYLLFVIAAYALARLVGLPRNASLLVTVSMLGLSALFAKISLPSYLTWLLSPGGSLLSVRSFVPFLILFAILLGESRVKLDDTANGRTFARPAIWGALGAPAIFWANDTGIPTVIALFLAYLLFRWDREKTVSVSIQSLIFVIVAGLVFTALLFLITGGDPDIWLFDTMGVAGDQFWFFPPFGEDTRIFDLGDLVFVVLGLEPDLLGAYRLLMWPAFIYILWYAVRHRKNDLKVSLLCFLVFAAAGSGTLAQIAGHAWERYYAPLFRVALFVVPYALYLLLRNRQQTGLGGKVRRLSLAIDGRRALLGAIALLSALHVASLALKAHRFTADRDIIASTVFVPEIGAFVDPDFLPSIEYFRAYRVRADRVGKNPTARIFSLQLSGFDTIAGAVSPSRYGQVIHSLGHRGRQSYVAALNARRYDHVTTPARQPGAWWFQRAGWFAFREILERYSPIAKTDDLIIWSPMAGSDRGQSRPLTCAIARHGENRSELIISDQWGQPVGPIYFAEVHISFAVVVAPDILPILGNKAILTMAETTVVPKTATGENWTGDRTLLRIRGKIRGHSTYLYRR